MDPINLLVGINLFVTISANFSGAKKGLKSTVTPVVDRPKSFLQKTPLNISAIILVIEILGVFKIGTLSAEYENEFALLRIIGLVVFIIFSWIQVWAFKSLGKNYSQEVAIMKGHQLHISGPFKYLRHPQYISQIISDLGAGLALLGYIIIPLVLLVQIPLFLMRASLEEKLLEKHFKDEFIQYKKTSGFIFPFIG